jgi:arginine decarboxylase
VLGVTSYGDLTSFAQQQSRGSAFILSIDDEEFTGGPDLDPAMPTCASLHRGDPLRNADIPIFLHGETRTSRHIPNDVLRELHGFIHMFEDTPEFVARYIIREAKNYLDSLAPPFFKALTHYAADGSYSWHCPGHSGGVAFLKSPVGQMFHQFFGENMLRADVCNAVEELGQLLDHTGPVAHRSATRRASSTPTTVFRHQRHLDLEQDGLAPTVAPGDVVVVDRNCHKSILHAIIMTGAVPVFLTPTRNHYGIIGPIPLEEFDGEHPPKIDANPLRAGRCRTREAAHLTITQSTYDGVSTTSRRSRSCSTASRYLHFDEAWLPHAAFHDFYGDYHAIGKDRRAARSDGVLHPVDAQAAGRPVSQASQILVQDSETRKLDRHLFNEAYLMHTSTSAAVRDHRQLRRGRGDDGAAGRHRAGRGIDPRRSISAARCARSTPSSAGDWWFKVWGPEIWPRKASGEREDWMLKAGERWHGFGNWPRASTCSIRSRPRSSRRGWTWTAISPRWGIPAAIVTKYLAEHGVIVEKTGLYSFFIMFTIGITKGRWNTLVTELQQFKDDYDKNQPLWRVMPEFIAKHRATSASGCGPVRPDPQLLQGHDVARLTTEMYLSTWCRR